MATQNYNIQRTRDEVDSIVGGAWRVSEGYETVLGRDNDDKFEAYFKWKIDLPKYSTITEASIIFTSNAAESSVANLRLQLLDYADANSVDWEVDPRPLDVTPITQNWTPVAWSDGERSGDTTTSNIDHLLQSFIDRSGYAKDNYMGLVVTSLDDSGTSRRRARSFDTSPSVPARLNVIYTSPTSSILNSTDGRSTMIEINATSSVTVTHWQIYEEDQDVGDGATSAVPYPIRISSNHTLPANVTSMSTDHISIWFPPDKQLKARYRFDNDNSWSELIHFTSMGYLTSYDRGRILSGLI